MKFLFIYYIYENENILKKLFLNINFFIINNFLFKIKKNNVLD